MPDAETHGENSPGRHGVPPRGFGLWFGLLVTAAMCVVALRYLMLFGTPETAASWAYALSATVGHMGLLAFGSILAIYLPCRWLRPLRRLARPLAILAAAVVLTLLVMDTNLFARHGFHLGVLTAALFEWHTWAMAAVILLVFTALSAALARKAEAIARRPGARWPGRAAVALIVALIIASHIGYAWADARYDGRVTAYGRYLPAYYPLTAKRFFARHGLVDPEAARDASILRQAGSAGRGTLNYPLAPLSCAPAAALPNVLMIVIDGLRFDAIDPSGTPFLERFGNDAIVFEQHYSGGNSTRMGMFSLLYGLPGGYFDSVYSSQTPALLMDQFVDAGYDFGIFAAYSLSSPGQLDRTAFARIPGLVGQSGYPNEGDASRDAALVETWFDFLGSRETTGPLFGYLHFDPPITNVPPATPMPDGLDDASLAAVAGDRARHDHLDYRRRLHYVDGLLARVWDDLEARALAESTLVIVTGDHGEEYDDSGQGLWGHGTGFSDYQIRTPLMLRWPGRAAARHTHRSSHFDLAPTLLGEVFGCTNPAGDYSIGTNLFAGADWAFLPVRSYFNQAIVTPTEVIITYPGGIYEVRDRSYRSKDSLRLDKGAVEAALQTQRRFLR